MDGIHEILNDIHSSSSEEDVLATIIRVEGSAYRKEGTSLLFRKDGTKVGMLSAGCLETDLTCRVPEIIEQRKSRTIVYDLKAEDDLSWGQGAGCNGIISVLLEPVDAFFREHLCKLKFHLDRGNRVTIIKKLADDYSVSDYLYIADNQDLFGKWQSGVPVFMKELISEVHQTYPKSGIIYCSELSSDLYIHTFEPKPRLMVFGAGADAVPLVKLASIMGFYVIVSDWRSSLCNEEYFPNADQHIVGFPEETVQKISFTKSDSVLILTHHFQRDKELLHHLRNRELMYLGVLGSKTRTQRLLGGKEIPPEINSPVGLPIKAEGPEEIAVSIVAELIQKQRNKRSEEVFSI